ncbi:hypothetical protein BGX27_002187 [Mortierella sp. AM989]|nr:hypothetical protein BGX27_002187 [Mortierella sp. AM989]
MRRYRRGGAVSSFALESFITMPSDKDLYHLIQDGWRQDLDQDGKELAHDVVVLDQDMKAGNEDFGRSPSSAWTLLSVLERGGGGCQGPIRLWYLEGGFEAFQSWDRNEKFLMRPGSTFEISVTQDSSAQMNQDVEMSLAEQTDGKLHPMSMPLSLPSSATSATFTDSKTAQAIDHAVSMTNASLASNPRRGPPARRESLFSLNTKSLQQPVRLTRSQTVGVSALNIKPLSIPPLPVPSMHPLQEGPGANGNGQSLQHKNSFLTVPTGGAIAPSLSPVMSLNNSSMEIAHSASSENTSMWSARSGDSNHQQQGPMLGARKSFSSSTTLLSLNPSSSSSSSRQGIQEEDEEGDGSAHPFQPSGLRRHHSGGAYPTSPLPGSSFHDPSASNNNNGSNGFHQEYQSRMFADGIDSYNNNFNSGKISLMGYDEDYVEEGGNDGEQEISCILLNFLYLGPEIANEEQAQELERLGIKRVLNMARECEDLLVQNRPGMEYHKIGVQDHIEADVSVGLLQAVDIIASADSPIYVHCKAGKSRSVTAIIAYLITQLHWSLNKAYNHVLAQRPCMCPNIGFVTELMRMEEKTLGTERAGGLARAGSLNSILSLSTAGSASQHSHHHYAHHSLQHHHSLSMGGSPKMLSNKSSMNSLAVLSPPFQP